MKPFKEGIFDPSSNTIGFCIKNGYCGIALKLGKLCIKVGGPRVLIGGQAEGKGGGAASRADISEPNAGNEDVCINKNLKGIKWGQWVRNVGRGITENAD